MQQVMQKDVIERKLKRVKVGLMRNPKFVLWSGILMVGDTIIDDKFPTACTDGRNEIYGRKFIEMLPEKQLAFVVLHENLHKAFRHLSLWKALWKKDKQLANAACDFVINLMLVDMDPNEEFIEFPKNPDGSRLGLLDEKYRNMNSRQVFDLLMQEAKKNGGGAKGKAIAIGGDGFDEHDWEGAEELSAEEKKDLEQELEQALRQGKMQHDKMNGKEKGSGCRELDDLLEPKIDWRDALREFITSTCSRKDISSWRRPNRRFLHQDVYLPSLTGESVDSLVVAVDTSGSMSQAEITKMLSEVVNIGKTVTPNQVDLLYWGSDVVRHERYDPATLDALAQSTKPMDGGGTSPSCITKWVAKNKVKPEAYIVLTDGEVFNDWGDGWNAPVLWVIHNEYRSDKIVAPIGKTIHLD